MLAQRKPLLLRCVVMVAAVWPCSLLFTMLDGHQTRYFVSIRGRSALERQGQGLRQAPQVAMHAATAELENDSIEVGGFSGLIVGLALLPHVLYTLAIAWDITMNGGSFSTGPFGLELLARIITVGLSVWSIGSFIQRGRGLPAGPVGVLGLAEGLSYIGVLALAIATVAPYVRASSGSSSVSSVTAPNVKVPEFKAPEFKSPEFKAPDIKFPEFKALSVKVPDFKAPEFKVPDVKIPEFKAPSVKVPDFKAPEFKAPDVKIPDLKAPSVKVPHSKAPELKASDVQIPELKAPSVKMSDFKAPDAQMPDLTLPDVKAPEVKVPEVKVPEMSAPKVRIPEAKPPEVKAPLAAKPQSEVKVPSTEAKASVQTPDFDDV